MVYGVCWRGGPGALKQENRLRFKHSDVVIVQVVPGYSALVTRRDVRSCCRSPGHTTFIRTALHRRAQGPRAARRGSIVGSQCMSYPCQAAEPIRSDLVVSEVSAPQYRRGQVDGGSKVQKLPVVKCSCGRLGLSLHIALWCP